MTAHARNTIRSAIATILRTNPQLWSSVTESRVQSPRQVWPYVMVFTDAESSKALTISPPISLDRTMTVSVVGLLRLPGTGDTYTIEDRMDEMAVEIETKLTNSALRAVVSKVQFISLVATRMDVVIEPDGVDHAEVNMTWLVDYSTVEGAPTSLI